MSDTPQKIVVEFGTPVVADNFEYCISEALSKIDRKSIFSPKIIELDMRRVEFIDIVSTQMLLCFVVACREKNWLPVLRLPTKKDVRDFWRTWNFPDVFKAVTGTDFARIVHQDDIRFIDENQSTFDTRRITKLHHHKQHSNSFRSSNFFGFFAERIADRENSSLADRESNNWNSAEIKDRINKHFGRKGNYFASHVIFEAIYNATKHANANVLVSSSFSQRLAPRVAQTEFSDRNFNLFFWDDGRPIYETLGDALKRNETVREQKSLDIEQDYLLRCADFQSKEYYISDKISHDHPLSAELDEEIVLLAALFPGTTSKPYSEHYTKISNLDPLSQRGMGIHILINAVVDILGGTVSFRTGKYFVNVKAASKKHFSQCDVPVGGDSFDPIKHKSVKIIKMPDHLPKFIGNLVTVRAKAIN